MDGEWRKTTKIDLTIKERRSGSRFRRLHRDAAAGARARAGVAAWTCGRCSRTYLAKGYRAVDFVLQREAGFGRYLLAG